MAALWNLWNRRPPSRPAPPAIRVDAKRSAEIDDFIAGQIGPGEPGVAISVVKSGTLMHAAGYGLADLRTDTPATTDTIFHLASCGKQWTALGILMLVEHGELGLDDSLEQHIPALAYLGPDVTLRRLLNHTSGICDMPNENKTAGATMRGQRIGRDAVIDAYIDLLGPISVGQAAPGEAFDYANTGYDLLGFVIERVSGQNYHDFFQSRMFDRLNMKSTFALPDRRTKGRHCATGYVCEDSGDIVQFGDDDDDSYLPGWFYTTISDLCLYDQALATNALISEASMRDAVTSGHTNDGEPINYGFGWFLGAGEDGHFAEHSGDGIGFNSYICRYLDQPLSIFALSNNPNVDLVEIANVATATYR